MSTPHTPDSPARRALVQALAGMSAISALSPLSALAQALTPVLGSTVKMVVGFPPGGTVDIVARKIGEKLVGTYTTGSAITENKAGAGGRIACETVKNAPADGATFLLTPSSIMSVYPVIYKDLRYDPFKDFRPVASAGVVIHSIVVSNMVPASVRNLTDFVAWARANPKDASYGSPAAGSIPHFIGAALGINAGVDLKHVPYRGALPGLNDILGGQLAAMVVPLGDVMPHLQGGKLRVLGISSAQRFSLTPNLPTFAEQGFGYITSGGFYGFYVPAKTPDNVVAAATAAINQALTDQVVIDLFTQTGLVVHRVTPAFLAASQQQENEYWGAIVRKIGFTGDT